MLRTTAYLAVTSIVTPVSRITLTLFSIGILFLGGAASAITIDFSTSPPEGPLPIVTVDGVDITGLQQNGVFAADVQLNFRGIGNAASANNYIQMEETVLLDFGSDIVLQGFSLFFDCPSCQPGDDPEDDFTLTIDGVEVLLAGTDGPLLNLPPESGPNGRYYRYDVAGTPTGQVLAFTGDVLSAFRVTDVTYVPEPGSAVLLGIGLALLGARLRRH